MICTRTTGYSTGLNVWFPSEGRGPTLQSSRSLDALSDLKLQQLEAELEGAQCQAEAARQREAELRADIQRLRQEVVQLRGAQRQVGLLLRENKCSHDLVRNLARNEELSNESFITKVVVVKVDLGILFFKYLLMIALRFLYGCVCNCRTVTQSLQLHTRVKNSSS